MATHEIDYLAPTLTMKADATELAYDKTQAQGHVLAGKDIAVEVSANGTIRPARAGAAILGKLVLVMEDQRCTIQTGGQKLGFLQGAVDGVTLGTSIVGATGPDIGGQTNGYVAATGNADSAGGRTARANARGIVTSIDSNTAGGTVRVSL